MTDVGSLQSQVRPEINRAVAGQPQDRLVAYAKPILDGLGIQVQAEI